MSKLIVEMEIRKNCLDCDLHQIVYGDSYADTDVYCFKEKRLVGKRFGPTKDLARPSWCPIKGVLPDEHGDLIDRSLLCADLAGVILSHSRLGVGEVIARQNAIIAAERSER